MVSHEVRTPLASILGFTRLLLERDVGEADRQRYLQIVDAEATRLAGLVSDFLDARLIEEGQFALRRELFDIRALVLEQAELTLGHDDEHQPGARGARHPVVRRRRPLPAGAGRRERALERRQVLALRAARSPSAQRSRTGRHGSGSTTRGPVSTRSTGPRSSSPSTAAALPAAGIPGTGLGLAVSRRIVEAHGGRIGFDALAAGTRFWIEMPVEEPPVRLSTPTRPQRRKVATKAARPPRISPPPGGRAVTPIGRSRPQLERLARGYPGGDGVGRGCTRGPERRRLQAGRRRPARARARGLTDVLPRGTRDPRRAEPRRSAGRARECLPDARRPRRAGARAACRRRRRSRSLRAGTALGSPPPLRVRRLRQGGAVRRPRPRACARRPSRSGAATRVVGHEVVVRGACADCRV